MIFGVKMILFVIKFDLFNILLYLLKLKYKQMLNVASKIKITPSVNLRYLRLKVSEGVKIATKDLLKLKSNRSHQLQQASTIQLNY